MHGNGVKAVIASQTGRARYLYCEGDVPLLFTENETNTQRIFGVPNRSPYVKDSIDNYIVHRPKRRGQPGAKGNQGSLPTIA